MRSPPAPIARIAATPAGAPGAPPPDGAPQPAAPGAGRAAGVLRLDEREVALAHAAARWESTAPELSGEAAPRAVLHLVLTDAPPAGPAAGSLAALVSAAAAGALRGVLVTLDAEAGAILDGDLLLPEDERPRALRFAGEPPQMRLLGFRLGQGRVEGRIATRGMIAAFEAPGRPYPAAYAVNAAFAAPLGPPPALRAVHDGPAAASSAPGVAAAAFLAVLGARDAAGVLDHVAETHPGRDYFAADPDQARRDLLGPASAVEMMAALTRVYEFDDGAIVLFDPPGEGSVVALRFVEGADGRWRLGEL